MLSPPRESLGQPRTHQRGRIDSRRNLSTELSPVITITSWYEMRRTADLGVKNASKIGLKCNWS